MQDIRSTLLDMLEDIEKQLEMENERMKRQRKGHTETYRFLIRTRASIVYAYNRTFDIQEQYEGK